MSHLEEGLLHAMLDGEIPSPELAPIQAHLATCPECRARLEAERQLLAQAEGLVELLEVPASVSGSAARTSAGSRPVWGRKLAWAASVFAALGLGYVARGFNEPERSGEPASQLDAPRPDTGAQLAATSAPDSPQERNAPVAAPAVESGGSGGEESRSARRNVAAARPKADPKPAAERLEAVGATAQASPDSTRSVAAAAPAPAPSPPSVLGSRIGAVRFRDQARRLDELAAPGVAEAGAAKALLAPAEPISFPDAIRRLGGSLRFIEGFVPLRLEAQGLSVRVVYPTAQGELLLSQQLVDGRVVYALIAPPGFPADSLARLKARVRE